MKFRTVLKIKQDGVYYVEKGNRRAIVKAMCYDVGCNDLVSRILADKSDAGGYFRVGSDYFFTRDWFKRKASLDEVSG